MTETDDRIEFKLWEKVIYFFPVQLLFVHLKKNLVLLLFWVVLFAIITKSILLKYGAPYLFLFPEYLGTVSFVSHFLVGIALGAFIMAFNLSSYVVNGFRFPFLATLNRPFIKYCQNNIILPAGFSILYMVSMFQFQSEFEHITSIDILLNMLGFISGNLAFIALTFTYFIATNRNTDYYQKRMAKEEVFMNPVKDLFSSKKKWKQLMVGSSREWKVSTYISKWGSIAIARDSSHYNRATLDMVFAQNRINASFFQVTILVILFTLGFFGDTEWLMIPAAASMLLFFTILIMLASAMYSWFKGWTSVAMIALILIINFVSTKEPFQFRNQAYGLRYDTNFVTYDQESIRLHQVDDDAFKDDITAGLRYLEHWKARQSNDQPTAVFINVPGGGLRSAMWAIQALNQAQLVSDDRMWDETVLVSGSSGGMIGAAYLREYFYRKANGLTDLPIDSIIHDISKDKLNAVASTAVMNDIFFRFKTFEWNGHTYTMDRTTAFEQKLNLDTRGWLDYRLDDLAEREYQAEVPMTLLAPTISNDGRKLIISPLGVSYLAHNTAFDQMNENVEFRRFFRDLEADSLSYLSALRMSATFPYVFPAANLPTEPMIEILDAGIRDNSGLNNTLKFIYNFRHWLNENTGRLVIIHLRDQEKFIDSDEGEAKGVLESIGQPLGTFYNTVLDIQDYQLEDQLRLAYNWYDGKIEVVELVLERSKTNPISLSWHLTQKEKERIINSINSKANKRSLKRIQALCGGSR